MCSRTSRPSSSLLYTVTAASLIYTLSLHDALPISPANLINWIPYRSQNPSRRRRHRRYQDCRRQQLMSESTARLRRGQGRSEEHTSELQSRGHLVCRLLLEKKKLITSCLVRVMNKA